MGWLFVLIASCFEMVGVIGLKKFSSNKNVWNAAIYFGGFICSFILLYQSFHYLQLSVAYAVWTGIGTAGAVLLNMLLFNESKSMGRVLSVLIIIAGVVGLKIVS
ncbi:paired small multidrug resistance pump [Terribacillus halophilus]|uniref:Paired small multidrug resistance pump n=1 Tax=Terribacillus halophilus TaxID=361279 RepID=A0A1G6PPQ7_9BACI|nr:multidrug efflux SMR transporter [Terribacillus halophilus]SDC81355.1 paired small multidrug resistance pump [Terribacillus halophilus]